MKKRTLALLAALSTVSAGAIAAVPTEVTTAITTAGTDTQIIGSAVLVVIVGIFGLKMLRKAL